MLKVLQVMAGAHHGGAETFFERLVTALGRAAAAGRLAQQVVIRRDAERAARLRSGGVDPMEMRFGGRLDVVTPWRLGRRIRAWTPDIVMTWMSRATMQTPRSAAVHVARLGGYYDLKYYRRCDHLVGNTPDIRDYVVREGWPAERAHYLPNFVDATPGRAVDRAVVGTPDDVPVVLALGRLHRNKAYDVAIRALAEVPAAHLWIAGEGPLRDALNQEAQTAGVADRVRFLGWRTDIPDLLASADLLVCPSRHEPLGNVVIEGWAHGVPVVAAASQGPRQLVDDGETGVLVPIDDAGALAAAMRRTLGDAPLAERLRGAGRAAYEAAYSEDRVVDAYLSLFERVATKRH